MPSVCELEGFSQAILRDSERVRKALPIWTKLKPGAEWEAVQKQARADFWENVIGKLPGKYAALNPRTRLIARACGTRRHCLSICSGDFNAWADEVRLGHASERLHFHGRMGNLGVGSRAHFHYAEMALLIAPRLRQAWYR